MPREEGRRGARKPYRHHDPEVAAQVDALVKRAAPGHPSEDLIAEIVTTALKLGSDDGTDRGEIKLLNVALKEMRYTFKTFEPYREKIKVTVFGSARTPPGHPVYRQGLALGRELARRGFMAITGAGPGAMQAVNEGAGREMSFGANIRLPREQGANPFIAGDPKLITFKYFFTRKLCFVKESDALILMPGGFGTLDEGFEILTLLQTGKCAPRPLVLLDEPGGGYWGEFEGWVRRRLVADGLVSQEDLSLFRRTDDVVAAAEEIARFYRVFHSLRYVGERLVVRVRHAPPRDRLDRIAADMAPAIAGPIEVRSALPEERDRPDLVDLPRLVLTFDRKRLGLLRRFIDALNADGTGEAPVAEARLGRLREASISTSGEEEEE